MDPQQRTPTGRVTGEHHAGGEAITVKPDSQFGHHLAEVIARTRPRRIIETGTYIGTGTTAIIAQALADCRIAGARFYTIECNPAHYQQALVNLRTQQLLSIVQPLHGVTVPRALLPTPEAIARECVADLPAGCEFVDHRPEDRVARYLAETAFDNTADDLLGRCLREFDQRPDLVLLDSAGHMGFVEFQYLIERLEGPCVIALDDVLHLKHCRSLAYMRSDPRFTLIVESQEKFGFCIATFTPSAASVANVDRTRAIVREESPLRIAIALVEHFGDIVACEPIARDVRRQFPNAHITWVVKSAYRELIDTHPDIDDTLAVECLTEWVLLRQSGLFDRVFDLHFQKRVCPHCGVPLMKLEDDSGVTLENYYTFGPLLHAFCRASGLPILDERPRVYVPPAAAARVDALRLPDSFIAVHTISNETSRDWTAEAWAALVRQLAAEGHAIVEVGSRAGLRSAAPGTPVVSLAGRTTLLETAEVIRRARLFIGIDSGPAHLANAVGTPGVIVLGQYRAFDRYVPYSGAYGNGEAADLVYAVSGPASTVSVDAVRAAVDRRLNAETRAIVDTSATEDSQPSAAEPRARVVAFYLPQFHPIPENDRWWGPGFTEWTNVASARPLFAGHSQPHIPTDLGYYDLRVPETRAHQAKLAQDHGIEAFCYWHYWFNGRRLLERPFEEVLASGVPALPFCLAWANEPWTRRWDGQESDVLQPQDYGGEADDRQHFAFLARAFRDARYLRVDGKPIFVVYRPGGLPDAASTVALWRTLAAEEGFPGLFLVAIRNGFDRLPAGHWTTSGWDAELTFQPNSPNTFHAFVDHVRTGGAQGLAVAANPSRDSAPSWPLVVPYDEAWPIMAAQHTRDRQEIATVVTGWDNSPRRGRLGLALDGTTPAAYRQWLRREIARVADRPRDERLVFVNAWNEWAEGAHLEPDRQHQHGYLEATASALGLRPGGRPVTAGVPLDRQLALAMERRRIRSVVAQLHPSPAANGTATLAMQAPLRGDVLRLLEDQGVPLDQRDGLVAATVEQHLVGIYNLASWLARNRRAAEAHRLFSTVAEAARDASPELAGRAHFKLGELASASEERVAHFERCLDLYPAHRAARQQLAELAAVR